MNKQFSYSKLLQARKSHERSMFGAVVNRTNIANLSLAGAAFIGFVMFQYSVPIIDYQLNADSMYIFTIVKDIVFDGGQLKDWFTSVHLFLYPDTLLALPILLTHQLGLPAFVACIGIYGLLLICLLAYAWWRIAGGPASRCLLVGSLFLGLSFCTDYLLYCLIPQQPLTPDVIAALKHTYDVGQILAPALHSGAFIIGFALFFPLYDILIGKLDGLLVFACLFCNIFLVTISDLMFLAWSVIPFSIVVLSNRNHLRRAPLVITLFSSAILGYLGSALFSGESTYVATVKHPLFEAVQGIISFAALAGSIRQPIITFFFSANLLLWGTAVYFIIQGYASPFSSVGRCLTIFAAAMSAASMLAPATIGLFTGTQIRYLIPYLVLGPSFCAFIAILAIRRFVSIARGSVCLGILALMVFAAGCFAWANLPGPTAARLYGCLKAHDLKTGRANFWDAAPIAVASGWHVMVAPLVPGTLQIFPWLTKRQWLYAQPGHEGSIEGFLILDRATARQAITQYGTPDLNISCAERQIFVYNNFQWNETPDTPPP